MNKELALQAINDELSDTSNHVEVIEHYNKLLEAINKPDKEFEGMKVLVFQPIAIGDVIMSSLCAELFQIKFPGCIVDYFVEPDIIKNMLQHNPFINNIIVNSNWNLFRERDTLSDGELKKQYDYGYSLYWWSPLPAIKSFLSDLELPTDYTRVRLYKTNQYNINFPKDRLNIALQERNDLGIKWFGNFDDLKTKLSEFGNVIEIGPDTIAPYDKGVETLRKCDLFVGAHGSLEHAAAAVGCQCVTLGYVANSDYIGVISYQNKYLPENRKHISIKPEDWCGDYRCIDFNNKSKTLSPPPYGFSSEGRFPPHMFQNCDYKNFKKTCIHEISVDLIIKHVKIALEKRGL